MNEQALDVLIERLDRLEREARRWRLAAVVVGVVLGLVVLVGATPPAPVADEIRARRFVVVDEAGKTRALLGVEDGEARLALHHETGRRLASLQVHSTGTSALYLAGKNGADRAWLEVAGDAPRLVFRDEFARQRVVLGAFTISYTTGVNERRPTSSLVLFDKDGKVLFKAP